MPGTVDHLPAVLPVTEPARSGHGGDDHPMRVVTREAAAGRWDPGRAAEVGSFFDQLAPEWHTRVADEGRLSPLLDALDRGGVPHTGLCLELGSGTGLITPALGEHFSRLVAVDLSEEMLRRAPITWPRARTDASMLPVTDGSVATVVLVNMLLFPAEVDRVLARHGTVVWVCTRGETTPIYLSAEDLVAALPGTWSAVASVAGPGTWAVARRA